MSTLRLWRNFWTRHATLQCLGKKILKVVLTRNELTQLVVWIVLLKNLFTPPPGIQHNTWWNSPFDQTSVFLDGAHKGSAPFPPSPRPRERSSHQKKKTANQVAAENEIPNQLLSFEKGIPVQENNKKARYNKIFKDQNWPKVITSIEEKYILLIKLFASEIVRQCNIGSKFLLKSRPRVQS